MSRNGLVRDGINKHFEPHPRHWEAIHRSISMACRERDGKSFIWRKMEGVVMNGLRWRWWRTYLLLPILELTKQECGSGLS
ncbi:MAG: hypothetical protein ACQ9MH_25585 [Nitrospinales bacterium]